MAFWAALFILAGIAFTLLGLLQLMMQATSTWTVGLLCFVVAGLISIQIELREIKFRQRQVNKQPETIPDAPLVPKKGGFFRP